MVLAVSVLFRQGEGLVGGRGQKEGPGLVPFEEMVSEFSGLSAGFGVKQMSKSLELIEDDQIRLKCVHTRLGQQAAHLAGELAGPLQLLCVE